jgi:hypothetical protein
MEKKGEKKGGGVLITAPNGEIYNILAKDLEKFKVAPEKVERTIMDAEKEGFLVAEPEMPMEPMAGEAIEVPAPQKNGITINIFYGEEPQQVAVPVETDSDPSVARSTMAKYAGGSTMTNVVAEPLFSNITFYGSRWAETEDSEK